MAESTVVFTAVYDDVDAARADLDALEKLHDEGLVGRYDAAVIDKEQGKPHVARRMDRPGYRIIPEVFGGGTLPRRELHEAAEELSENQAGLIVVAEPTVGEAIGKAIRHATKTAQRSFDAHADDLARELSGAFSGS